jgi:hypothetical protein
MSDPSTLTTLIDEARDAFNHTHGDPTFEPKVNASATAIDGEVAIQKACRLLEVTKTLDSIGSYYGAVLEHSFIIIEQTLQGYLLAVTGVDGRDIRDHDAPYELSKSGVPLEEATLDALKALYDDRRTEHYYGTTVTTEQQAASLKNVALRLHQYVVGEHHTLETACFCTE